MSKPSFLNKRIFPVLLWVIAIIVRLYGAFKPAQIYDIATFEAWSHAIWIHGPSNFFSSVWSDYLPLPILSFAPISFLADFFQLNFGLIFKLVHLAIELVLLYFISSPLSWLLLLSPALIGDNAFWGQVDTIPSLLALLSLSRLVTPRRNSGVLVPALLYGLAVAYKPIMILIAPVLWIVSLKSHHKWYLFPLISGTIFLITGIPTGGADFFMHLWSRVIDQSSTYPYLTVNAFNLWSLVPNLHWVSDSTSVFNLSGRTLGLTLFVASTLKAFYDWRQKKFSLPQSYRLAAIILIAFFAFTTRMHERHLLFGLPFLALASMYDKALLLPYALLTLTFTLNLYGAYYWVNHAQTWPFDLTTISLISWVTVLTTIALISLKSFSKFFLSVLTLARNNFYLVIILLIAIFLRFTNLSHPNTYIFDEVYHAFTSREFLHNRIEAWEWWTTPPEGVAYEWTHPPVAKYGMVLGMLLFGENSLGWRIGSATMGVVSILGIYLLVLSISKNKQLATLSAFLVSIEGLHISQSRIAMNDIYMLNFLLWSLYLAVKSRWKVSAILYGLALGSKWSALYGIIPLAATYLYQHPIREWHLSSLIHHFLFALRCLLIACFIYVLTFTPFILAGHTWPQWWELHRQMWYYHTHLVATHEYQSTPYQWIFGARPVWYWVGYAQNHLSNIYAFANPLLLWFGLISLVLQIHKIRNYLYFFFTLNYLIFVLPWIFSPRIMFFYHYLPSSVFLSLISAHYLSTKSKKSQLLILFVLSLSLLVVSPFLFGFSTPKIYWDTIFAIFPSWR